jgi:SET domain-containing protein
MINHSCQSNVTWSFEGRELRIIATKDLSAGEEIYITYIDDLGDYYRRRRLLKEQWGINCVCPLCKEGPKGLSAGGPGKPLGDRILKLKDAG